MVSILLLDPITVLIATKLLQRHNYLIFFFTILDQTVILKAQAVFIQRVCLGNVKQTIIRGNESN